MEDGRMFPVDGDERLVVVEMPDGFHVLRQMKHWHGAGVLNSTPIADAGEAYEMAGDYVDKKRKEAMNAGRYP